MANLQASPIPRNDELLWLQKEDRHRSYRLFTGQLEDGTIKSRRCDVQLWKHIKRNGVPKQVFKYISSAGFGGVFRTGFHKIDHALVATLVERWCPETHTFRFPTGEATITLQDIKV